MDRGRVVTSSPAPPKPEPTPGPKAGHTIAMVPQLKALGVRFDWQKDGEAAMHMPYADHLIGFPDTGVIAGGAIYTLMDSCCGTAVFSALKEFKPLATLDLRIDYLKPATPHETVRAYAHCYKVTRHVAFVRGVAYHDDQEDPIANVSGTFVMTHLSPAQRDAMIAARTRLSGQASTK